jgi:hypothetical protein
VSVSSEQQKYKEVPCVPCASKTLTRIDWVRLLICCASLSLKSDFGVVNGRIVRSEVGSLIWSWINCYSERLGQEYIFSSSHLALVRAIAVGDLCSVST